MRADFREFYSLSFDKSYEASRVETADLVAELPRKSRVMAELDPRTYWSEADYLLASLNNSFNFFAWAMAGKKRGKKPALIEPPKKQERKNKNVVASTDNLDRILSKKREEVINSGRK